MSRAATAKNILTRIGAAIPMPALNYLFVGNWMRSNRFDVRHRFDTREALFNRMAAEIADCRVLYLEFGVFEGRATRMWSKLLRNPRSYLHGFDSFEGLPEQFTVDRGPGYFSTNGRIPKIDDPRVTFFKGWFNETLTNYKPPEHDVLVLNMDADLYSSTSYVLKLLCDIIQPGSFLYFDEFNHRQHELSAFEHFCRETGKEFELFGVTTTLEHVAFRCSG
jgi:Macrocin-O-methyltransferase (TylF)